MHWSDHWLGRRYDKESYNCSHFLADVLADRFGLDLGLPAPAPTLRARDRQVAAVLAMHCRPRTGDPQEGDIVLAWASGRRADVGHHSGVLVLPGGEKMVLHNLAGIGACRHPLIDLSAHGLVLDGIYQWVS